ncbi:ABC transporter permease [Pseudogracilibacillus sp. SO30301A]|uniref:ABC transporter permease n=1 Tax=Pseudogracilibacillus sp. SO30301A TaxID=3098291 RepID=UPI00300E2FFA
MEQTSKFKATLEAVKKSNLTNMGLVLIFLLVIASIFSPYFLDPYNLQSLVRDLAFISIIALAQSCLMIIGELDLSVGKIAAFCGVIGGMLMVTGSINPYLAFGISLLLGAVLGLINGTIVTRLNLNSIVVTIGMTGVYGGIVLVLTKGKAITGIPKEIYFIGQGYILGIPVPFVIMLVTLVVVLFITQMTQLGRYMYAIGNSPEAAKILGIKVNNIRTIVFILVGFLSSLAGMLMVARLGTAQPSIGDTWALNSIAAAVIGGIALTGGLGNPFGAIIGAAIITVIQNIIVLFGVSPYWQTAVSGILVVLAISFHSISTKIGERKRSKIKVV